jgi:ABC-2 type transport system permease protein
MMRVIIKKELAATFNSPFVYVVLVLLTGATGLVYWFSNINIFYREEASLSLLFRVLEHGFLLLVPFLTMKSIAGERETGTLDLLFSKPIKTWEIIGGKYCAILIEVTLFLLVTSIYYVTILFLSDTDPAIGWCGYLGLLLVAGCYVSIGMFASSLTRKSLVALPVSFAILLCFRFLLQIIAELHEGGFLAAIFHFLSVEEHFGNISRGIIDTRDLIYFCSVIVLFLALTRHYTCRVKPHK